MVFVERNAHGWIRFGMPKGDRLAIKAKARPFLRATIHWLRKSRDALVAGDMQMHGLLRDRARMYHAFASLEFFHRYAKKYGESLVAFANRAASGGKGKAEAGRAQHSFFNAASGVQTVALNWPLSASLSPVPATVFSIQSRC
jgi:hypothetical protein